MLWHKYTNNHSPEISPEIKMSAESRRNYCNDWILMPHAQRMLISGEKNQEADARIWHITSRSNPKSDTGKTML